MDPILPKLEHEERRRRTRLLFKRKKVPVRMLVPNFFTLLSLCAGLTAIRMAIDSRFEMAVALIVVAGLLDAIDGRVARLLKAQSRFGAELDSLADFVNFGVAPVIVIYTWGLSSLKGFGWITVLVFSIAMGLRLARFNAMLEVEKPHWMSNYFTGVPAPAGAIAVMLPVYLHYADLLDMRPYPQIIAVYTMGLAFLLASSIPTFSGKLMGEKIEREWVLPILVGVGLWIALLMQYPHQMLAIGTAIYLGLIPLSWRRFARHMEKEPFDSGQPADPDHADTSVPAADPDTGREETEPPPFAGEAVDSSAGEIPVSGPSGRVVKLHKDHQRKDHRDS